MPRPVYLLTPDGPATLRMEDLHHGDVFRVDDPERGTVWRVVGEPYLRHGAWVVDAEEVGIKEG